MEHVAVRDRHLSKILEAAPTRRRRLWIHKADADALQRVGEIFSESVAD